MALEPLDHDFPFRSADATLHSDSPEVLTSPPYSYQGGGSGRSNVPFKERMEEAAVKNFFLGRLDHGNSCIVLPLGVLFKSGCRREVLHGHSTTPDDF